jgi:hypothetical protein
MTDDLLCVPWRPWREIRNDPANHRQPTENKLITENRVRFAAPPIPPNWVCFVKRTPKPPPHRPESQKQTVSWYHGFRLACWQ